jgi:hypothetical protein
MYDFSCSPLYYRFLLDHGPVPDEGDPDYEVYKQVLKVLDKLNIL